ncbi:MAG TPA: dihydrofolate reductase [Chitinophagaceae bacterium]|nr:dihydrofolate reductase [Chitinophagaceae bacterium]
MIISLVVAASTNNVIGKNNQLIWHLPNDMKFFKNTTWAMPVIMGRKTFESMAKKPLTGRFNIVVTRSKDVKPETGEIMLASSLDEAFRKAEATDCKESFVIGGGEIFKEILPKADKIYMTRVHAELEGDTFFPVINGDWKRSWKEDHQSDEKHAYSYSFELWERNEK